MEVLVITHPVSIFMQAGGGDGDGSGSTPPLSPSAAASSPSTATGLRSRATEFVDARLSVQGVTHASMLRDRLVSMGASESGGGGGWWLPNEAELVVCSPLTRALETATVVFGCSVPTVACDLIAQFRQSACDEQRPRSELAADFPHVDFALVAEQPSWRVGDVIETRADWRRRLAAFIEWLRGRPEKRIAVVTHAFVASSLTYQNVERCSFLRWRVGTTGGSDAVSALTAVASNSAGTSKRVGTPLGRRAVSSPFTLDEAGAGDLPASPRGRRGSPSGRSSPTSRKPA